MARTIYHNNDVKITSEPQDPSEAKINVNGQNLIWISLSQEAEFKRRLSSLLDEFRI